MDATITPRNRPAYTVALEAEHPGTFRNSEEIGWQEGTFRLREPLDLDRLEWIRDAGIVVHGSLDDLYVGRIKSATSPRELSCNGHFADALSTNAPRDGVYCDTDLSSWFVREYGSTAGASLESDLALACTWPSGHVRPASAGFMRYVPKCDALRVIFDWTRYNTSAHTIQLYASARNDTAADTAAGWTLKATVNSGASGTTVVDVALTDCEMLLFWFSMGSGSAIGQDERDAVTGVRVFIDGLTTTAATDAGTLVNPSTIVGDCLDQLSASDLGGREIVADTTSLKPFLSPGTDRDRIDTVRSYVGGVFRGKSNPGGAPIAVFKARPSASSPAYSVVEDGVSCICDDLKIGAESDALFSAVRVAFTDGAGVARSVDRFDTNPDHYLVKIGRSGASAKWADPLSVNVNSPEMAALAGDLFLSYAGADTINGTVTLVGDEVCLIQPGEMIQIESRDHGTVIARIRELECIDETTVILTLDNTENMSDLVIRAFSRATAASVSRVMPSVSYGTKVGR